MSHWTFPFCPQPPDWKLDWSSIHTVLDVVRALTGVPQDPVWHAEGDVLIHTRMGTHILLLTGSFRSRGVL